MGFKYFDIQGDKEINMSALLRTNQDKLHGDRRNL